MASPRIPTAIGGGAYHEQSVNFASTAAEATSAAVTFTLPTKFKLNRPIFHCLKIGEAAMDDNAAMLPPSYSQSAGVITVSMKFVNNNAAAGAAIDPGAKVFCFWQP